jgi:LmbE family N-acetylglucosaminyl deacetylase
VICVTNGAPRRGAYARDAGFSNWLDYAAARRRETEAALSLLERDIAPMHNLGIADQEAIFELVDTTRYLVDQIRSGFAYVITHAYEGGHPDHDSTAFCVHAACMLIAKGGWSPPAIVEAPLYSAPDGQYIFSRFVPNPDAGPSISFTLTPAEKDLKRRMFDCHVTQKNALPSFSLDEEFFRLSPRYHFSAPPHSGDVGYNKFKWPVTGRVWRTHAWRAMRELGILEELA